MDLKVLAIAGSPRPDSNTGALLRRMLDRLAGKGIDVELVSLEGKNIQPCKGCLACREKGACIQKDDFAPIFAGMLEADGLIVGTPVHFSSAVPAVMALLDRAGYCLRSTGKTFAGKVGGPVVVARRAGHNFTFAQLLLWFFINEFVIPGSSYWNVVVAGAGGARDTEKDREGLSTLDRFADNMALVLTKLRG